MLFPAKIRPGRYNAYRFTAERPQYDIAFCPVTETRHGSGRHDPQLHSLQPGFHKIRKCPDQFKWHENMDKAAANRKPPLCYRVVYAPNPRTLH